MKWLCKLGFHNWKIIKLESTIQIESDLKYKMKGNNCKCTRPCACSNPYHVTAGYPFKEKKICRDCGKFIDEIKLYTEKIIPYIEAEIELEQKCLY